MWKLALVLVLAAVASAGLYGPKGPVRMLTKSNFAQEIILSDSPAIVEFFAPVRVAAHWSATGARARMFRVFRASSSSLASGPCVRACVHCV